ncbi:peptidoglycan DD-metalloendopeptidase family protein [Thermovibrio sp.]
MKDSKLQIIVIKNELGDYARLSVSLKKLKFALISLLGLLTFLSITSFISVKELLKERRERVSLEREVKELKRELQKVSSENGKLKAQVARLKSERERTVEELAKRIEEINSLMKEVGLKTESPPEGGIALPLDKALKDPDIELKEIIPGVDKVIKDFKRVPIGYPTEGRITSDFGLRRNPITGALEFHLGVDIANRWGTPVRATGAGKVVRAGWCGLLGNCVEIDHGNGYRTFYGHLAKVLVHKGDFVSRGMIIGIMGSSGRSTGPHLHYSIKFKNKDIDPKPFLEVSVAKEKGKPRR